MLGLAKNCGPSAANVCLSVRYARERPRLFAAEQLRAGGHIAWGFEPQVEERNKTAALKGRWKGSSAVPLQGTHIVLSDSWG